MKVTGIKNSRGFQENSGEFQEIQKRSAHRGKIKEQDHITKVSMKQD